MSRAAEAVLAAFQAEAELDPIRKTAARRRYRALTAPPVARFLGHEWSVRKLARAVGLSTSYVSLLLRGLIDIRLRDARKISNAMGIPLMELITYLESVAADPQKAVWGQWGGKTGPPQRARVITTSGAYFGRPHPRAGPNARRGQWKERHRPDLEERFGSD